MCPFSHRSPTVLLWEVQVVAPEPHSGEEISSNVDPTLGKALITCITLLPGGSAGRRCVGCREEPLER